MTYAKNHESSVRLRVPVQPFQQLDLPCVIEIVGRDPRDQLEISHLACWQALRKQAWLDRRTKSFRGTVASGHPVLLQSPEGGKLR
jgi:hypothetical protein